MFALCVYFMKPCGFRLIINIGHVVGEQILVCRLIDRPIRPMIAHGFHNETQILVWVSPKRFGLKPFFPKSDLFFFWRFCEGDT